MSQTPPPADSPHLTFGGEDARPVSYEEAQVVVLPVPYEGTVSYGQGAAAGPDALLQASGQLEMYDEETDTSTHTLGIHTLSPLALNGQDPTTVQQTICDAAFPIIADGKFPVTLGGEHAITPAVLNGWLKARPQDDETLSVLQIDAHADLRQTYQGTPHSHACAMARVLDLGLPIVQVGIRAISAEERSFLRSTGLEENVFWAHRIAHQPTEAWVTAACARLRPKVYVTIDLDGLDPSIMPATGTPEPGGLQWYPLLQLLRQVAREKHIVGFDIMELAPIPGMHAPDFLAARLTYKLMGYALGKELG